MFLHFKIIVILLWLLGIATVVAACVHGANCFGIVGGVWFGFFAAGIQAVTYKVIASPDIKQGFVKGFAVVVNVALFLFLAHFQPRVNTVFQTYSAVEIYEEPFAKNAFNEPRTLNEPDEIRSADSKAFYWKPGETDPRLKHVSISELKQADILRVTGSVKSTRDLVVLRDQIERLSDKEIFWDIRVGESKNKIVGIGYLPELIKKQGF